MKTSIYDVGMAHPGYINNSERKYPFARVKIADNSILNTIEGRRPCSKCGKSRKFFCYTCYVPVLDLQKNLPYVKLPIKIDIIKHKNEIDGKSTAAHAPILAPNDVRIFTYPDIPDYQQEDGVVLIFPSSKSLTVSQLFDENIQVIKKENFGFPKGYNVGTLLKVRLQESAVESSEVEATKQQNFSNLPIKRAVFVDSTWNQSRGIYKDERISSLKSVVLQNRISQFWRHQRGSPRWYLATIEAIHQFLLEIHINAWGLNSNYKGLEDLEVTPNFSSTARLIDHSLDDDSPDAPYCGQYDNLLFFFSHMYDLIHIYYDHNDLKSYKRPI